MFADSNNLQFARERNDFLSEPGVEQTVWPEAIGYEAAREVQPVESEHARAVHATVQLASEMVDAPNVDASLSEAREIARSGESDTKAEHDYFMGYAKGYGRSVQSLRDFAKSDFDRAA